AVVAVVGGDPGPGAGLGPIEHRPVGIAQFPVVKGRDRCRVDFALHEGSGAVLVEDVTAFGVPRRTGVLAAAWRLGAAQKKGRRHPATAPMRKRVRITS